nr:MULTISPECIES: hypothetical protein [unclassified Yoonia]
MLRQARRDWITRRQPRMRLAPHRLVFIDETAVKTNLTRLRGRAPVGERLYGTAPFGKWGTQTFIAGLTQNALIAPWVITGAMNAAAFDTYTHPVDLGTALAQPVQKCFTTSPVVGCAPMIDQRPDLVQRRPLTSVFNGGSIRPSDPVQTFGKVVEIRLWDVEDEWSDVLCHVRFCC